MLPNNYKFLLPLSILPQNALPIGCLSVRFASSSLASALSAFGLSEEVSNDIFLRVKSINMKARIEILDLLRLARFDDQAELSKALICDLGLIERSLCQ